MNNNNALKISFWLLPLMVLICQGCSNKLCDIQTVEQKKNSIAYYSDYDFFSMKGVDKIKTPSANKKSNYFIISSDSSGLDTNVMFSKKLYRKCRFLKRDSSNTIISNFLTVDEPWSIIHDSIFSVSSKIFLQKTYIYRSNFESSIFYGSSVWLRNDSSIIRILLPGINVSLLNYKNTINDTKLYDKFVSIYSIHNEKLRVIKYRGVRSIFLRDLKRKEKTIKEFSVSHNYLFKAIIETREFM